MSDLAPSGRVTHLEKITVYLTPDELTALEAAHHQIRHQYGIRVDRGRIVREALHLALTGLAHHGQNAPITQRVREIR